MTLQRLTSGFLISDRRRGLPDSKEIKQKIRSLEEKARGILNAVL